jgi:hypothetical protein
MNLFGKGKFKEGYRQGVNYVIDYLITLIDMGKEITRKELNELKIK